MTKEEQLLKTVERHTVQINALHEKTVNHAERMAWLEENTFTKTDQQKIFDVLDFLVQKVTKIDDDHVAMVRWLERHDRRLDRVEDVLDLPHDDPLA